MKTYPKYMFLLGVEEIIKFFDVLVILVLA
jgi:hypothetical protein